MQFEYIHIFGGILESTYKIRLEDEISEVEWTKRAI